jgi:hypothetical protein
LDESNIEIEIRNEIEARKEESDLESGLIG